MVGIGDVARDRDDAGEAGDRMLERLRPARVDDEPPAALGESAGEREPEAARCSGDDPSHTRSRLQVQVNLKSSGEMLYFQTMSELLPIGEVARRSGVASSALRFYEQRGLISSERAGSGHRRYPRPVLRRIAFIVFAQRIGLTLDEIGAELAKLPPHQAPTRRDWSRLSATWPGAAKEHAGESSCSFLPRS